MITVAGVSYAQMADSITPADLPQGMDAYLGYGDGRWPDAAVIQAQHPGIKVYALTVFGSPSVGNGVDSEWGAASPMQAAQATQAELARGVQEPVVYCPESWALQTVQAHQELGIDRSVYRLLCAHYQGPTMPGAPQPEMHICGSICGCPVEADGTQWFSSAGYDLSLLKADFLAPANYPGPPPGPKGNVVPGTYVGMAATVSGKGYWQVTAQGHVACFGDAVYHSDAGDIALAKPMVGMARTPDGNGYWLVAADGGVFCYGSAAFYGSPANTTLNAPVRGLTPTPTGKGYWLHAEDGGVFSYGDATFEGSAA